MGGEDAAGGDAERGEVAGPVEPIPEALEEPSVDGGVEAAHEARRRLAHARERPVDPRAEEVDAAVGHARREQGDEFAIGGVAVAEGIADGVEIGARGPVGVPIEPLERFEEPRRGRPVRGELPRRRRHPPSSRAF